MKKNKILVWSRAPGNRTCSLGKGLFFKTSSKVSTWKYKKGLVQHDDKASNPKRTDSKKGMKKGGSDLGDNWNHVTFPVGITNKVFNHFLPETLSHHYPFTSHTGQFNKDLFFFLTMSL